MPLSTPFTSTRIRLRALEHTDAPLLHQWEHSSEAWQSADMLHPFSMSYIERFVEHSGTALDETGMLCLMIERLSDGQAIGYVQLTDYAPISGRLSLGIYIDSEARLQGFAQEALSLCESYAYKQLRIRMLYAQVLEQNVVACKLFSSLGYQHTATLPQWLWVDGAYHSVRYYQKWRS